MTTTHRLAIQKLHPAAQAPHRATPGAAGYDLCACEDVTIPPRGRAMVPLGFAWAGPAGFVGLLFSRSGHGAKHGLRLSNAVGVIDVDYRGEWACSFTNDNDTPYHVTAGERVAQLLIMPVEHASFHWVETLGDTARGAGGFGSTGR